MDVSLRVRLIVCCDGLKGLPDAIRATWPDATVQTCVVGWAVGTSSTGRSLTNSGRSTPPRPSRPPRSGSVSSPRRGGRRIRRWSVRGRPAGRGASTLPRVSDELRKIDTRPSPGQRPLRRGSEPGHFPNENSPQGALPRRHPTPEADRQIMARECQCDVDTAGDAPSPRRHGLAEPMAEVRSLMS